MFFFCFLLLFLLSPTLILRQQGLLTTSAFPSLISIFVSILFLHPLFYPIFTVFFFSFLLLLLFPAVFSYSNTKRTPEKKVTHCLLFLFLYFYGSLHLVSVPPVFSYFHCVLLVIHYGYFFFFFSMVFSSYTALLFFPTVFSFNLLLFTPIPITVFSCLRFLFSPMFSHLFPLLLFSPTSVFSSYFNCLSWSRFLFFRFLSPYSQSRSFSPTLSAFSYSKYICSYCLLLYTPDSMLTFSFHCWHGLHASKIITAFES